MQVPDSEALILRNLIFSQYLRQLRN